MSGGIRPADGVDPWELQVMWSAPISATEWQVYWRPNFPMDADFQIICITVDG